MATHFLQLGPADADLLAEHLVRWQRREGVALDRDYACRESRRMLANDEAWHAWLIRTGGRAVGYLVVQFRPSGPFEAPRAQLAAIYLEPEARGLGIARKAHTLLLDLGRWLQVRVFPSDVAAEDRHAAPFAPPAAHRLAWFDTLSQRAIA